jgi:D-alanyl-D-alanine carboxypeptidase
MAARNRPLAEEPISMRMIIFLSLLAFASSTAMPANAAAPSSSPPSANDPTVRRAIDAVVQQVRATYGGKTPVPGVLVGVWDASGGSYRRGYGYADVATKQPMSLDEHFRIGSNTKTFVVAVLLQLVDERKLSLDDTVAHFDLGVTVPNGDKITVRQLCDMRSGLVEAFDDPQLQKEAADPNRQFTAQHTIAWALRQKPYFAPDGGYHYSNTNYLLLGMIVEKVTHDSVGDQIRKRLLQPYGLTQTSYPDTQGMPKPWAHGYGFTQQRTWDDVSGTVPVSLMGSAGAMISDMADIKRWIALYTTGKVSGRQTYAALKTCKWTGEGNLYFGLALGCSAGWYGYTGGLPGYNTADYYFPSKGVAIVAWVDTQNDKPLPGVANAVFRGIAKIMTPNNVPFVSSGSKGRSGL